MRSSVRFLPTSTFLAVLMIAALGQTVRADVAPGDIIDQTNYQKIEGLVPDFITHWVRDGEMTMKIGKANFNPGEFWPQDVWDHQEANKGRYRIDENNGLIDVKTGKPARGVKGLPFTDMDTNDPTMPVMLMWSNIFAEYFLQGSTREIQNWLLINPRGLEKTLVLDNLTMSFDPTKSNYDYGQLTVFRKPFNISGIGSLALYCMYPLENGLRYAYTPELRRMKRLSHRVAGSQTQFGEDYAPDDSSAGGSKINLEEGIYRFIDERDGLVPYAAEDPRFIDFNEKGELEVTGDNIGPKVKVGFEDPEWKGAPWHITNLIWVKTKVYVIESRSNNPNYNYGPCEGWIEKGSSLHCYKRITDVNGNFWKGVYSAGDPVQTRDGKFRIVWYFGSVDIDTRRNHGTVNTGSYRQGAFRRVMVKGNEKLFTKSGYAKFSK